MTDKLPKSLSEFWEANTKLGTDEHTRILARQAFYMGAFAAFQCLFKGGVPPKQLLDEIHEATVDVNIDWQFYEKDRKEHDLFAPIAKLIVAHPEATDEEIAALLVEEGIPAGLSLQEIPKEVVMLVRGEVAKWK